MQTVKRIIIKITKKFKAEAKKEAAIAKSFAHGLLTEDKDRRLKTICKTGTVYLTIVFYLGIRRRVH